MTGPLSNEQGLDTPEATPTITLTLDQVSRLAGYGDGCMNGGPLDLAVNAFSSLARRLRVLVDAPESTNVTDFLTCEIERADELARVFFELAQKRSGEASAKLARGAGPGRGKKTTAAPVVFSKSQVLKDLGVPQQRASERAAQSGGDHG